jgi:hypothetical protein
MSVFHPYNIHMDGIWMESAVVKGCRPGTGLKTTGSAALVMMGPGLTIFEVDYFRRTLEAPTDVTVLLREFCDSVERHDGKRFADLFCKDGVYHDVFYGEFAGRFS